MKTSIIIPTLNEGTLLKNLLSFLSKQFPGTEVVVVDGGSSDDTCAIASQYCRVIRSVRGRAVQMNAGAAAVSGDIYWFLHADCIPPENGIDAIEDSLSDNRVVGGGFRWALIGNTWYYPLVTRLAHRKNKIKRNLFGDMGIFVRARVFKQMHGYTEIPFLEDMDFCRKLKRTGKIVIRDEIIFSSDRKLAAHGAMKTFIKNDIIKFLYRLGVSPAFLRKMY